MDIYGTRQAAEYLGLTYDGLAYHLYKSRQIEPDGKLGHDIYFTRATLDAFRARRIADRKRAGRRGRRPRA